MSALSSRSMPAIPSGEPLIVYKGPDCSVTRTLRGETFILTFVGTCSPALKEWVPNGLRAVNGTLALNLKNLVMIDTPFVRGVIFAATERSPRKQIVALIDPPQRAVELVDVLGAKSRIPVLSSDQSIPQRGSLADYLQKEERELAEISSSLETNPVWRRVDREQQWLCPICGKLVDEIKLVNMVKPGIEVARSIYRHLSQKCPSWVQGNRTPMAASLLDARLHQINEHKAAASAERSQILSRQVEGLQKRVETMEYIEGDLKRAQRRQFHMLPIEPEPDPIVDIAVAYRPADAIGGDFLDFYKLPGNRFGASIGDVSGHGVEAAIVMGMAKKTLRIRAHETPTVRVAMEKANADLHEDLKSSAFVTAFFCTIDRASRTIVYARAGHPPPLLRRAGGVFATLDAKGLPLGVDAGTRFNGNLEEFEVDLVPGDIIVMYTDGVSEAGVSGGEFGDERLQQALMSVPEGASPQDVLQAILRALDAFLAGAPQDDDVTLICLKVK
jgi:serine phosphatase RsbU (regulator of sigma subunit)